VNILSKMFGLSVDGPIAYQDNPGEITVSIVREGKYLGWRYGPTINIKLWVAPSWCNNQETFDFNELMFEHYLLMFTREIRSFEQNFSDHSLVFAVLKIIRQDCELQVLNK